MACGILSDVRLEDLPGPAAPTAEGPAATPPPDLERAAGRRRYAADAWWLAGTELAIGSLLIVVMQLWHARPGVPLSTPTGDTNLVLMGIKNVLTSGWVNHGPRLGAPFGQVLYDYPASAGDALHLSLMKLLGVVLGQPARVLNVFFLLTFLLIGAASFITLRALGLEAPYAALGAIAFTFLPYHFLRGQGHVFLGAYYAVPPACYLIVRQMGDDPLLDLEHLRRSRRPSKRALAAIGICVLLAVTGSYYAVFTVLLLLMTGFVDAVTRRTVQRFVAALALAAVVLVAIVLAAAPNLAYIRSHGTNEEVAARTYAETEFYGLHISNLLLPVRGHRIAALARLRATTDESPIGGEATESLGLFGAVGLVGLLVVGLAAAARARSGGGLAGRLSVVAMVAMLLGTIAGISSVIAAFGFQQIRGWNRISVFIGFVAIAGACLGVRAVVRHFADRPGAAAVACGVLSLLAVWDQTTPGFVPAYAANRATWKVDEAYVAQIERLFRGGRIFQLPYVPFPENGPVVNMTDYDHLRGYLHSRTVRWSHGGVKGREADWQPQMLSGRPTATVVADVTAAGFDAIWIDRAGYSDAGAAVEKDLDALGPPAPIVSASGRFAVYDLRPLRDRLEKRLGQPRVARLGTLITHRRASEWRGGAYPAEGSAAAAFRWMKSTSEMQLMGGKEPVTVVFRATVGTPTAAPRVITFRSGTFHKEVTVAGQDTNVEFELLVPREGRDLTVDSNVPPILVSGDPRPFAFRVSSVVVTTRELDELERAATSAISGR